ncbi:MAG: hypothetical protein MUE42_14440 [Opitutaceae bacterium]|nr:hypothetical protein [Opitutaceae bacterium]
MRPLSLPRVCSVLAAGLAAGTLSAQTPAPATAASSPAPAPAAAPATPAAPGAMPASLESNTLIQIIDKAFDTDSDSFNPEDGTLNYKGHTYNLGQMRVFRARFERYLAQPESIDNDVYRAILNEIFSLLSTRMGEAAGENTKKAWQLLYRASEYEADGGASLAVANQVFNAWRIRDERDALNVTQGELDRIRRQQQIAVSFAGDSMARDGARNVTDVVNNTTSAAASAASNSSEQDSASTRININSDGSGGASVGGNTGRRSGNSSGGGAGQIGTGRTEGEGAISQLFRTRELAETEAKIRASETSAVLTGVQAKLQFQTALVNLFLQRRFQHCLIAASFYRYIFKGSAQQLEVGQKEIASFLPSSDLALTVDTLEFLSREAINETEASMQSVRASFSEGQLVTALERLQETFFLGEYTPAVAGFERDKKQVLHHLYRQIDQARKLADLKDYDAVDKLVAEISSSAKDFRSSEVISAIRSAQRMSSLAIQAARQALVSENFELAQENIQRAASIWPLNPDLQTYTESIAEKMNLGSQAARVFDEAVERGDWRRIFDQRVQLGMALLTDATRGKELEKIIETVSRVEIYLTQARELVAQNNAFAAWEALDAASRLAPNDVAVNQRRAELAPRVASFVGKLDSAQRHEDAGRPAAALTQWLAAQSIYPASSLARLGISRVSTQLLDQLSNEAAPGAAPAPSPES